MKHSIGLLAPVLATLAGCQLYFGDSGDDGDWNYCGSDGYYECSGDDCYWRGPDCPTGGTGSGGMGGGGFECTDSSDCAAGCYCGNGVCEEAGFCTQDSDCGMGYTCNEDRSSCEPEGQTVCGANEDCPAGQYCEGGTCTSTCVCSTDAEAAAQGFDYCDEWRITCMSGTDPAGTCAGQPTCNIVAPTCQPGDVPLLGADGCWNGECEAASQCADPAPCGRLNTSTDCLARTMDCRPIYAGSNCTKTDGSGLPCQDGDTDCTCANYAYHSCVDYAP
jgi:hypothetical protein